MIGHEYFIGPNTMHCETAPLEDKDHDMCFVWCENPQSPPLHYEGDYSNNREFLYIVEGTLTVIDQSTGKTFTAFPDDLVIYHSKVHSYSRTNRSTMATTLKYKTKWGNERHFIPIPTSDDCTC